MTTPTRKLATTLIAWVMVATPFIAFVPNVAAHTTMPTGGTFTLDVDLSGDPEDDFWTTDPIEWGVIEGNLELRHVNGEDLGLPGTGDYDEDDIDLDMVLCRPDGDEAETLSAGDMLVESDDVGGSGDNVDVFDDSALDDPLAAPPYFSHPVLDGLNAAAMDNPVVADRDGKVSDSDRDAFADANPASPFLIGAVKGTFEEVTFDMNGVWYVIADQNGAGGPAGDGVCGTGFGTQDTSALITAFVVEAQSALDISVNPAEVTFGYDDDTDEPEPEDLDVTVTAEWGGDGVENAQITLWACDRARPANWFCDDQDRIDETDDGITEDPAPIVGDDGIGLDVELTGGDGSATYDDDFPGAGTYLIQATCILMNDSDEYISDPEDVEEAEHECVEPSAAELGGLDNPEDTPDFDGDLNDAAAGADIEANEVAAAAQIRGNTTFTILPGTLDVEAVEGVDADLIDGRTRAVTWKITYAGSDALVLADNTHGTENGQTADNIYANADANFTLDITLPTGKHVLLNYNTEDSNEDGIDSSGAEVDDNVGILECSGESEGDCEVDNTDWDLVDADEVTECDAFAADSSDCPTYTIGGILDDEGDVDVIVGPEDEDDVDTGLDPRVFSHDGTDADWGAYLRTNPAFDDDVPCLPLLAGCDGFNVFEDIANGDFEDEDFRLGWLTLYVPWAAGSYKFELRVNHFSDAHPEFVGSWTLDVAAAPAFGFTDVGPDFEINVPARTGTTSATVGDWLRDADPKDGDADFEDDIDLEDDEVFSYVLAFRIVNDDNEDVNQFPCDGDDRDGDTVDADGEEADYAAALAAGGDDDIDPSGDNLAFWPEDGDDRDCAEFDVEDDLSVTGNLLYDIRDEWIQELFMVEGDDALEECVAFAGADLGTDIEDADFGATEVYQDIIDANEFDDVPSDPSVAEVTEGNDDIPLYCIFNVVPMSPDPVVVHAMIDGEEYTLEFDVVNGGTVRVLDVTAASNQDGSIRVSVTNADGSPISGDLSLFLLGDSPADTGNTVDDEGGEVITASSGTFTIDEEDEIEAGRLGIYGFFEGDEDGDLDYAYGRVNLEPASDLEATVSPSRVTAGVETTFEVNVTVPDDVDVTSFEAYFLTSYDYARFLREGATYVDSSDYRNEDALIGPDPFDFDFDAADNEEDLTLKAEGPYRVYVRDIDGDHDNNGTLPTIEVVPPQVVFTPGKIAFALEEDVDVTVMVKDHNGEALEGTLRVAFDPDNEHFTDEDYGYATFSGADVDNSGDEDDDDFGGFDDTADADDFGDGNDWSYLEYRTTDDISGGAGTDFPAPSALPEINVDEDGAEVEVTTEEIGPVEWVFEGDGGIFVNTTGMLELVPPAITVVPDRLTAGTGADVSINVKDLAGEPVENVLLTLCGTPLSTSTTCTGVVSTDASGNAVVSVLPAGTGQVEVYIHESVEGDEAGDCDIELEDFARVDPRSGTANSATDADALDDDCDDDPAAAVFQSDDMQFDDTGVVLQVVATQSLLKVTVPDTVQVGAPTNIAVSRGAASGAQTPVTGASVTVAGPTGANVFTGTTNAAGQVSFTPNAVGTYTVKATMAGFQDGSASFQATTAGAIEGTFEIVSFTIDPTSAKVGDTVEGRATIKNAGATSATATVLLLVDGAQRASQAVTLGPGESLPVSFDFTPSVAKSLKLAVKVGAVTSPEQTLTVTPKDTTTGPGGTDDPDAEPEPTVPGFEAVFALAAIGVALAVLGRRKK